MIFSEQNTEVELKAGEPMLPNYLIIPVTGIFNVKLISNSLFLEHFFFEEISCRNC